MSLTTSNHIQAKQKWKPKVVHLFIPALIILLFLYAGSFITIHPDPKASTAIIVLSGGLGRIEEGADLYHQGYASSSTIILSNSEESSGRSGDMLQTAIVLGIPESAILTENKALSTYQNAEFTLPIMEEHGFTSAIVVSSEFHMRRVKFIFDHVYKDSGIKLNYVGSDSGYNAKWWWADSYSRETTFNEYIKMVGNFFGYNGPEAKGVLKEIKNWFH